jgi:sugar transferase EpsL
MTAYRGKRLLDLVIVLGAAPMWLPLLAVVAWRVRTRIGSPVLFRQRRPGLNAVEFEMVKFRTMTVARGSDGTVLPDSQRMTPFGRRLRASSLDELPELVNVLRGHMSLVGPRPLLPQYLERYSPEHRRRHAAKPGITGLAQVSGRNVLEWCDRLDLDVRYVDECSLALDVQILWRTLGAVLRRDGINAPGDASMPEFMGYE